MAAILDAILNISISPMMPRWHHSVPMYGHIGEHIYAKTFCADYFFGLHPKSSFCNRTIRNDSFCACGNSNELSLHFLPGCEEFSNQRILTFRETRPFHPLSVNYLLFGRPNFTNEENTFLFQAVYRYIKNTKRFIHV